MYLQVLGHKSCPMITQPIPPLWKHENNDTTSQARYKPTDEMSGEINPALSSRASLSLLSSQP